MTNFSGNLQGKVVFIGGGAGNIGGMAVRGCLRAGATVVTASRSMGRFDRLRRFVEADGLDINKLIMLEGDVSTASSAKTLYEQVVERAGIPNAVVTSLGGSMAAQSLLEMSTETWRGVLNSNLDSHLLTAQAFLPAMIQRGDGTYILVSGYGAYVGWPNGAPVSIAAAGVIALGRNLAAENKNSGVRIATMVLATGEHLWQEFQGQPGAFRGDDVGDFLGWLVSDEADNVEETVLHYVTNWEKANAMRRI